MKLAGLKSVENAHDDSVWAATWVPVTETRSALLLTESLDENREALELRRAGPGAHQHGTLPGRGVGGGSLVGSHRRLGFSRHGSGGQASQSERKTERKKKEMREMERKLKWNFCFFWVEAEEEDGEIGEEEYERDAGEKKNLRRTCGGGSERKK
jgi:hypothetical protein